MGAGGGTLFVSFSLFIYHTHTQLMLLLREEEWECERDYGGTQKTSRKTEIKDRLKYMETGRENKVIRHCEYVRVRPFPTAAILDSVFTQFLKI